MHVNAGVDNLIQVRTFVKVNKLNYLECSIKFKSYIGSNDYCTSYDRNQSVMNAANCLSEFLKFKK